MKWRVVVVGVLAACVAASAKATSIGRVTLAQMEQSSTVIFVGEFVDSSRVRLGGLPGQRYRFRTTRFLRGGPAGTVQLSVPDFPGLALGLEEGQRYLVFSERRRFGSQKEVRLSATGYFQGVYRLVGDRAVNDPNGVVVLDRLAMRLRR